MKSFFDDASSEISSWLMAIISKYQDRTITSLSGLKKAKLFITCSLISDELYLFLENHLTTVQQRQLKRDYECLELSAGHESEFLEQTFQLAEKYLRRIPDWNIKLTRRIRALLLNMRYFGNKEYS